MAPSTPSTPDSGPEKKAAARKSPTRKSAAKAASAQPNTADAPVTPAAEEPVVVAPDSGPLPETAAADVEQTRAAQEQGPQGRGSVLDGVRANRVGPPAVGLAVALGIGLLLSVLVPSDPNALALSILGVLLAAAVGFSMRYLSVLRNVARQFEALVLTAVGVHVMAITGAMSVDIPMLSQFGVSGPGFNEAFLTALAIPPVSTGGLIAGIVAAIIVGWGRNPERN